MSEFPEGEKFILIPNRFGTVSRLTRYRFETMLFHFLFQRSMCFETMP